MAIVKVKKKHQVTIPAEVREEAGIEVGDFLEAKIEKGKVTLTPKSIVDKRLAEALDDVKAGRTYGPFKNAEEMMESLNKESKNMR